MGKKSGKPSAPGKAVDRAHVHGVSPATIRRMRDAAQEAATDGRRGSELGRLALRELQHPGCGITPIQESAGARYAELRDKWRMVTGIRQPHAPSPALGSVRGGGGEIPPERAAAIELATKEAEEVLETTGRRVMVDRLQLMSAARRAVDFVCDRDCIIVGHEMLLDLRAGLDALARHWGMVR